MRRNYKSYKNKKRKKMPMGIINKNKSYYIQGNNNKRIKKNTSKWKVKS